MQKAQNYKRKLTGNEAFYLMSPYSTVSVAARIKGTISKEMLQKAVKKAQRRHTLLRVRVDRDEENQAWFVSDNAGEIPIIITERKSDQQWINELVEGTKLLYELDKRPAIRFLLVQSPDISELIILCLHFICDGMSLAFLMKDLITYLALPDHEVEILPDPIPIKEEIFPEDVKVSCLVKFVIKNKINTKWQEEKVNFNQDDYQVIHDVYWKNFTHKLIPIELNDKETKKLIRISKDNNVTVNTALIAAFARAHSIYKKDVRYSPEIAIAASVRDRLKKHPGESLGFYAGGINTKFKYKDDNEFWVNAQHLHKKVEPMYNNKNLFSEAKIFEYIDPSIWESRDFKVLGTYISSDELISKKIKEFSHRNDTVKKLMKKSNMDSLDNTLIGTAITNLGKFDIPTKIGSLEVERLYFYPGGGFPLVTVPLVLGVMTSVGKMTIIIEYAEEAVDTLTMNKIKEHAMKLVMS